MNERWEAVKAGFRRSMAVALAWGSLGVATGIGTPAEARFDCPDCPPGAIFLRCEVGGFSAQVAVPPGLRTGLKPRGLEQLVYVTAAQADDRSIEVKVEYRSTNGERATKAGRATKDSPVVAGGLKIYWDP